MVVATPRAQLTHQLREHDTALHELATRHLAPADLPSDLTLRQVQVLFVVRGSPGVTGQELSESLHVSTPTISGLVERLVCKDLLARHTDTTDRRRILLSLTERAAVMLLEMESVGARVRDEMVSRLSVEELQSLVLITGRLREVAEEWAREQGVGP